MSQRDKRLTAAQFETLCLLIDNGPMTILSICGEIPKYHTTEDSSVKILQRMAKRGLIERIGNPGPFREATWQVTSQGIAFHDDVLVQSVVAA